MILTQEEKTAVVVGNIQQNTVGIDAKNVNFITSLLTEKLYSKPIQSFLREIVSNAYDSHIEAKSDEPVLIKLDYDNGKNIRISIRDYGTGLSPERFDLIYKNIGSSTKRESNDYIGALGLGRFSALAVSNKCTIISCYNGTKDIYEMYKDGGIVHIDKLFSTATGEHNGIEVSVVVPNEYNSIKAIERGIKNLVFFSDVYLSSNLNSFPIGENFNKRKVRKYNSFAYVYWEDQAKSIEFSADEINQYREYDILYGDVIYPVKFDNLDSDVKNITLPTTDFLLRFNLGELDITPSRESLQMTKKTINAINNKLREYKKEISGLISNEFGTTNTLIKFLECFSMSKESYLECKIKIGSTDTKGIYFSVDKIKPMDIVNITNLNVLYKGMVFPIDFHTVGKLINQIQEYGDYASFAYKIKNKYRKMLKTEDSIYIRVLLAYINTSTIFIHRGERIPGIIPFYLKGEYTSFILSTKKEEKIMLRSIFKQYLSILTGDKEAEKAIEYALLRNYFSKRKLIEKKDVSKKYIDDWNYAHKKTIMPKEKADSNSLVLYGFDNYKENLFKIDSERILKFLKRYKVYVFDKNSPNIPFFKRALRNCCTTIGDTMGFITEHVILCATATKNIQACYNSGMLSETDFLSKDNPIFRKYAAIKLWLMQYNLIQYMPSVADSFKHFPTSKFIERDRVEKIIKIRRFMGGFLSYPDNDLLKFIDEYISVGAVDWKTFLALPTKEEMQIADFEYKDNSTPPRIDAWRVLLTQWKLIPMNIKEYCLSKKKIYECIKGRW